MVVSKLGNAVLILIRLLFPPMNKSQIHIKAIRLVSTNCFDLPLTLFLTTQRRRKVWEGDRNQ